MRPAATYSSGFRFESGNLANALTYDIGETGSDRWNNVYITLASGYAIGMSACLLSMISLLIF